MTTTMKSLNYGVEIEFTGIKRESAANIIAKYFHSDSEHTYDGYDTWVVKDDQGRKWKVMRDGSICTERKFKDGKRKHTDDGCFSCELVTPILQYDDIIKLQEIIRALRKGGAVTNKSCGIHIHVGAEAFKPIHLINLAKIFYNKEDMIYTAIECDAAHRNMTYCKKTDTQMLQSLLKIKQATKEAVYGAWYGDNNPYHAHHHYDDSRYHGLNLHAYFTKGTVEFRCFNSELHAGKVKAYIQLCLAMAHNALVNKSVKVKKHEAVSGWNSFRCWLYRLGLGGAEFETLRHHLLKLMPNKKYKESNGAMPMAA